MKQYTVVSRFFVPALKKYLPIDAVLYRSDTSSKLIIASTNDSNNSNNYALTQFEYVNGNDIAWFDSLIAQGSYSAFLTLNGTLAETVNGVGVQGYNGTQGFKGFQGYTGAQGFQGGA